MKLRRYSPGLCAALGALALLLVGVNRVSAQDDDRPAVQDPPSRVARLSFLYGAVSFQPAGESDWVTAVANRPLTTGDSLWVDTGARAELHVGSTAIRLGQGTSLTLLEVSDHVLQVRVAQGSMIINTRRLDDDDVVEADTPNLAFSVVAPGEYRIDVDPEGTATSTAVLRGQGQVNGGGRAYTVVAGQQARFEGLDSLSYEIAPLPRPDSFDGWSADRDRREDRSVSAQYVSRDMTGYEDLDTHGQWSVSAGYGPVWTPVGVPVGWAPYRYGHWAWIEPWGWTWVDDQPWGFAPFHYGRWAFVGSAWVWIPGPVAVRPVYAPALVAYVGGGPGAGFGLVVGGGPGVGWFPLGPGEVFVPPYRVSRVYVTNVNITNTRVERERVNYVYSAYTSPGARNVGEFNYANRVAPGGVTVVSRETFVGARPVGANMVAVNRAEIERAPVSHVAAVAPVRNSVMGSGAPVSAAPPAAVQSRRVVGNRMPAAPPAPFVQRQAELNAHPGQMPVRTVTTAPRGQAPVVVQPAPTGQPPRNAPPPGSAPAGQPTHYAPSSAAAPTAAPTGPAPHTAPPSPATAPAGQPPHNPPPPAAAPVTQPAVPQRTEAPQATPPAQPKPAPHVYERIEPPPVTVPAPAATPTPRAAEPAAQPPAAQPHPAFQTPPPPKPSTPETPRQEEPKPQRLQPPPPPQQQQQQQPKPAPQKSSKPAEKDKDKEKDKPGKP